MGTLQMAATCRTYDSCKSHVLNATHARSVWDEDGQRFNTPTFLTERSLLRR